MKITKEIRLKALKQGWIFVENIPNKIHVEKIDDTFEWEQENDYTFKIPQLNSDLQAVKFAKKMGFKFSNEFHKDDPNYYEIINKQINE